MTNKVDKLAELILKLHNGEDEEQVKEEFRESFGTVRSSEIIAMEQRLVDQGMPVEEIQRLCDIHADVFNGSIEEIHGFIDEMEKPGHPVHVLKTENRALENHLENMVIHVLNFENKKDDPSKTVLLMQINELFDLEKHYKRKEECFFPLLEKHGFNAPPQVMWGVDDEIRADLKAFWNTVQEDKHEGIFVMFEALRKRIEDMIFKEDNIMLPMIVDVVTEDDWLALAQQSKEIGYCLVSPTATWVPARKSFYETVKQDIGIRDNLLNFKVGSMRFEELEAIMNMLPIDVTFVDKDDTFRYFNQTKERVFFRSETQIGRQVQHCHPPKSLAMVEGILNDFKNGVKDEESFWIPIKDKLIYISYYALRDTFGQYMGTLEVSMDIKPYQMIQGQKRLRDE